MKTTTADTPSLTAPPQQRIHGLDVARALAIAGMAYNHLAPPDMPGEALVAGYPSALFAVLAGFSVALMTAQGNRLGGTALAQSRHRLLVRGILVLIIGAVLQFFPGPILIVLSSIAAILIVLGPTTRWSTRNLCWLLAAFMVSGPIIQWVSSITGGYLPIVSGAYPLFAWLCYGIVGILVHRYLPQRLMHLIAVAGVGIAVGATSIWLRTKYLLSPAIPYVGKGSDSAASETLEPVEGGFWGHFFALGAHTGGIGDVIVSAAMAVGVIAACVALCRVSLIKRVLYPIRALGSMSLSAYVLHVITAALFLALMAGTVGSLFSLISPPPSDESKAESISSIMPWPEYQELVEQAQNWEEHWEQQSQYYDDYETAKYEESGQPGTLSAWLWTMALLLSFASVWKYFFRRGPAEWFIHVAEKKLTTQDLPPQADKAQLV